MTLTYLTQCNACPKQVSGWPDTATRHVGWSYYEGLQGRRLDFCEDCTARVEKLLDEMRKK